MRILFVTHSLGFGGAEKMLTFVAENLKNRGHKISIINMNTTYMTDVRKVDEAITVYNVDGKQHGMGKLNCLRQMVKIGRKEKPQLLVGFTLFPNIFVRLMGFCLNVPSVMADRGDPYRDFSNDLSSKLILWLLDQNTGGVFQTKGAMEFYSLRMQKRGAVIPNPIFVNGEVPQIAYADREKTVVSVGRLDNYQKRYDVMLKAFALFSQKHPEYILKLYGDGSDTELIKQWAQEMGIADKVRFMGLTRQPMKDIARDGMFLITSDFEGISNSLLEAMAAGLPCVSTDHTPGGARLLITDHEDGLLAPVEDAGKLADAMCEYAENPVLAEKCGENAKAVLQRFHPERIIDLWENYCRQLVKGNL